MKQENNGWVVHNSTPKTFNQYTYSLDDKVTQKPIMMESKKEVFTGIKSPEISSSHTIKYTTPSTHIVNVDRKFDMSKMHTEYFQNKPSKPEVHSNTAINEPSVNKTSTPEVHSSIPKTEPINKPDTHSTVNQTSVNRPENHSTEHSINKPETYTNTAINEPSINKTEHKIDIPVNNNPVNNSVFTSEEIKFVPFSLTTYAKTETPVSYESSKSPEGSPIVINSYKPSADYSGVKSDAPSFDNVMTIDLGHSNKRVSDKILNENTSRINDSSATHTDKGFIVRRKDMINSSYVQLQDRIDNALIGGISTLGHTMYRQVENGDDGNFRTVRNMKDGAVVVTSINATGRTIGRQAGNINRILSDNTTRLENAAKYIKGAEKKDFKEFKEFNPYNQKQLSKKLGKFSDLTERRMSSINREIRELKKMKIQLSPEQQKRLAYLLNYKELKKQGKILQDDIHTMRGLGFVVRNGMYAITSSTDDVGVDGMLGATEILGNRYVRKFISGTAKGSYNVAKFGVKTTGNTVKFVSDKTGLTKQINKGTAKLMETGAAKTTKAAVETVKHGIHGGVYNAVKEQVVLNASDRVKKVYSTTKKVTQTSVKVVNKGVIKPTKTVAKGVKKGYHIASTPFRWVKKATGFVKLLAVKTMKWLLLIIGGGLLAAFLICGAAALVTGIFSSVFASDTPNIQEYANYIIELQNNELDEVQENIADLREQYDSLEEPVYYYTHKESMSNGKEILSMAAVWNDQNWPKWYNISQNIELKNYIDDLFDNSHSYHAIIGEEYECAGCKEREEERTRHYSHSSGCRTDADGNSYCPGHTTHYTVTVIYCDGHRDVDVEVTVLGFDEIFNFDNIGRTPDASRGWEGWWYQNTDGTWNYSNMEWAKNFYNQDWLELYGLNFAGSAFTPDPITAKEKKEIMDKVLAQYPDLAQDRIDLLNTALSVVGRVPYFWGGGHHQNLEPGIDLAWGVEQRVIWAEGNDNQPKGSYQLYGLDCSGYTRWVILTSTGSDTMYYGAEGQRTHCTAVSRSNLKPGDFANTGDDGHVGIYLYTENGRMYFVHCSPSVDGVGINAPGYFTKFYRPNGISR